MKAIGIDIGSYSIKVAELEGQLKAPVVRDFYEIELNREPGQDVRLEKIEALRKIATRYDARQYRFVVGLGSEFSTNRVLNFPFLERRKILQSMPFELEDVVPFSQADAIFDFRIIYQKIAASKVLAFAVPKKYIQELLILCEDAGLSPDIVSLDGVALANHFDKFYAPTFQMESENTIAAIKTDLVVHIGYSKTLVDVLQDGRLIASRALYFGGKDLTNSVMRAYQIPYLEALKGVAEKGFVLTNTSGANEDQVAFSNTISQSLNILVNDLQRTIVDLKSELQCEFTAGYLMGGMGRLINLGPYLTERLQIPFDIYHHLDQAIRSNITASENNERAAAIAIGLAIEAFRKPRNPAINFRKNEFSKQSQKLELMFNQYKDVAKIVAAALVLLYVYTPLRLSFTEDNVTAVDKVIHDQAKNPLLGITPSQLKPESLKKYIKSKREEIESKKQVMRLNQMNSALDILRSISSAMPQKPQLVLDVRHLDIDGEQMVIEGLVNSRNELETLKRNLSQASGVSRVTQGNPRLAAVAGKVPFLVTMNLTRLPPAEKAGSK